MTHTKGEWRSDHSNILSDKLWIAECYADTTKESESNAHRIVQCVNSHDGLVEALKEVIKYQLGHGPSKTFSEIAEIAKLALKSAEGDKS